MTDHTMGLPTPSVRLSMPTRRQFITMGSAAVAGALFLGAETWTVPSGLQRMVASSVPRIPMAFVEGSAGTASLAEALGRTAGIARPVVDLARGSSAAASSLTITGLSRAGDLANQGAHASVLVDALVASPAVPADVIPFAAWTMRTRPVPSVSTPAALHVPATPGLRVGLSVQTLAATATVDGGSVAETSIAVFGDGAASAVALRPGIYLLGLRPDMWSQRTRLPALGDPAWAGFDTLVAVVQDAAAR